MKPPQLGYTAAMRCWSGWWRTLVGLSFVACSGADVTPAAAPVEPSDAAQLAELFSAIGEPCPSVPPAPANGEGRDEIFVEAALVDVPRELAVRATLRDLAELAQSRRVKLVATPHMIGAFGTETKMGLGGDGEGTLTLSSLKMLPRHVDEKISVLELELELSQARRPLRFSSTARDNQPSLSHVVWDEAGGRALLVLLRSFRVHGEAELRSIFECKMQQRSAYVKRLRDQPRTSP